MTDMLLLVTVVSVLMVAAVVDFGSAGFLATQTMEIACRSNRVGVIL